VVLSHSSQEEVVTWSIRATQASTEMIWSVVDSLVKRRLKIIVRKINFVRAIPISKSKVNGGVSRVLVGRETLPILETDGLRSPIGQKP
jgi:hypothetical protein